MPIRMLISANGFKYFKVVSGIDCKKSHWDERNQRIKTPRKSEPYNYSLEYNKILDDNENGAKQLFRYMLLNDIAPSKKYIAERLENGQSTMNLSHEFLPSFDEFIEKGKNIKAKGTLKKYKSVLNFYKGFSEDTGYQLRFDTITLDFFEKFRDYCFEDTAIRKFLKLVKKTLPSPIFRDNNQLTAENKSFPTSKSTLVWPVILLAPSPTWLQA